MDDIENRMEEIQLRLVPYYAGGASPEQMWKIANNACADLTWLLTQLTSSRKECEQLRTERDTLKDAILRYAERTGYEGVFRD